MRSRMKGAAYTVGGRDWEKLSREQDKDHSGQISWEEFHSMCRRVLKLTDEDHFLLAVFQSLDADGSGEVAISELILFVADPLQRMRTHMKAAAKQAGGEAWHQLLREQDRDGSGQVDWAEFRAMCRQVLKSVDDDSQLKIVFRSLDA